MRRLTIIALLATLIAAPVPAAASPAAPSTVTITAPAGGAVLHGTVRLTASAPGARRVEFFVNGVRVARDSSGPSFSVRWDTKQALDGDYQLVARAGSTLSAPVHFIISGQSTPAPPPPPPTGTPPQGSDSPGSGFPECDKATASNVLTPTGPAAYRPASSSFGRQTVMDANGASWSRESAGDYPVIFKDQKYPQDGSVCWLGGSITSSEDMAATWDAVWHHTVGFYTDHPYTTIVGLRANNQGDCIGIKDPGDASLTRIDGVSLTDCHDDVIENDLMKNVEVTDSLLEGYVLFAGRGGSAGAEDGRNNTYRIDGVVGWLKPQQAVYKGPQPGTGPLFKRPCNCSSQGWEPNFTITNSIFRVDQKPNHGDLSIPPGPHSNNVIVWTGAGAYPGPVPPGFRVTTDLSVWSDARAAWVASH